MNKPVLNIPKELEPSDTILKALVDALYPILIPVEEQDMRIQFENAKVIEMTARVAWASFFSMYMLGNRVGDPE
jgi:hypothetical protein